MKKLYVISKNHMDLIWRRGFVKTFKYDGFKIRPYTEIEQLQLNWWLKHLEDEPLCYDIEQTVSISEYLSRNPDEKQRISSLMKSGKLTVLGGGESVIDYNLVDGESIVRNHFYSLRYLKEEFGVRPRYAACPDTFGLSAQLPQVFRLLGYPALSSYHRVFQSNKPVWRGISGHLVALETAHAATADTSEFFKYFACTACEGEGCSLCGYSGVDTAYRHLFHRDIDYVRERLETLSKGEGDIVLTMGSEEVLEREDFYEFMTELARDYGCTTEFIGIEDYIHRHFSPLIDKVISGDVPESMVDERCEGNPVAGGCYISRIRIKQENRLLENMMQSAERLSVIACEKGGIYPSKAFEKLWLSLSALQFHDGITASHCDDAYEELMDMSCQMKTQLGHLLSRGFETLVKRKEQCVFGNSFTLFNPLPCTLKGKQLSGVFYSIKKQPKQGYIIDEKGRRFALHKIAETKNVESYAYEVFFTADIPPFGFSKFTFVPESLPLNYSPDFRPVQAGEVLENEFYRISFDNTGISEIYDKGLQKAVAVDGVCSPYLSEDIGSLWGTMGKGWYKERADKPFTFDFNSPSRKQSIEISKRSFPGGQEACIRVIYERKEELLLAFDWQLTISLRDKVDSVDFHIETGWKAQDLRLSARFPFPFTTKNDCGVYEIPFGQLLRDTVEVQDSQLGISDSYPAHRYFCAYNKSEDWSVAVFNRGTPSHRLENGVLHVGLLRSPSRVLVGIGVENAREDGKRSFDFSLSSWRGSPREGNPAKRGSCYNAFIPVYPGDTAEPICFTPLFIETDELMLSAMKRGEEALGTVLRFYEPYGKSAVLKMRTPGQECDLVTEEPLSSPVMSFEFKPFEIKSIFVRDMGTY